MAKDEDLFARAEAGKLGPTLRLYQWQPQCISLGYSQRPEKYLNIPECRKQGWDIVQRITGGGIVFHNCEEITYSLFLPLDHPKLPKGIIPSCNFISSILLQALQDIGITGATLAEQKGLGNNRGAALCFSRPTKYEIVYHGKKLIGSAQKRGKRTLMQHGSVCVARSNNVEKCVKVKFEDTSIGVKNILGNMYSTNELKKMASIRLANVF